MGRYKIDASNALEQQEGALACLGSALVVLDLIEVRIDVASRQQPSVLQPAMADLAHARRLIRRAQRAITPHPHPARAGEA